MKIKQISVFMENRKGHLFDVASTLGEGKINIKALTVAESCDFGVLRMIVDNPEKAVDILREKGFTSEITDVVVVEVEDNPGGLSSVLKVLGDFSVNVEYMYGFGEKFSEKALMVLRIDDIDKAIKILQDSGINVVGSRDVRGI